MRIKVSEATNTQLNWMVAKADGCEWLYEDLKAPPPPGADYTTDWAQGGPIIDADCMSGPTPLIAAMRCFVSSKLGDEVEIPEELK